MNVDREAPVFTSGSSLCSAFVGEWHRFGTKRGRARTCAFAEQIRAAAGDGCTKCAGRPSASCSPSPDTTDPMRAVRIAKFQS